MKLGFKTKDITNQVFNRLTVLSFWQTDKLNTYWTCKCICGALVVATYSSLVLSKKQSCGCLQKQRVKSVNAGNKYSEKGHGVASFNSLYGKYKFNSKNRGYKFELTKEQFKILTKQNCVYCGKQPEQFCLQANCTSGYIYNGVDRLNNNEGYDEKNSVTCCKDCNIGKGTKTENEFLAWIKRTYEHKKLDQLANVSGSKEYSN